MPKAVQKIFCIVGMFCMFAVAATPKNKTTTICYVSNKYLFQDKAGGTFVHIVSFCVATNPFTPALCPILSLQISDT